MKVPFAVIPTVVAFIVLSGVLAQSQTVTFQGEELSVFRIEHAYESVTRDGVDRAGALYIDCMDILDAPDYVASVRDQFTTDLVLFCMVTPSEDAILPLFLVMLLKYQPGPSVFTVDWLNAQYFGSADGDFRPNEIKMVFLPVPNITRGEPFMLWYMDDGVEAILEVRE